MHQYLQSRYSSVEHEAGIDEAGRGCLAGPVVAAAVILPPTWTHSELNDSKLLKPEVRIRLRELICQCALSWAIGMVTPERIDEVNILNASYEAMHIAIQKLSIHPQLLAVDGNRFAPFPNIDHVCIIKGDAKYAHIAAASILAKTFRDEFMQTLDQTFPQYGWAQNKGYPTKAHKIAIRDHGPSPHHRTSFNWKLPPRSS